MAKDKKSKWAALEATADAALREREDRIATNNRNRNFGKAVEREVAALVGGERTPGSGAFKHSNRNLTGDVEVRDGLGRGLAKIECKGVSVITPSGERTFTLKRHVLDQAFQEADIQREIPVVWVHWHQGRYVDDAVIVPADPKSGESAAIIPAKWFIELIELAKLGAVVREKGTI